MLLSFSVFPAAPFYSAVGMHVTHTICVCKALWVGPHPAAGGGGGGVINRSQTGGSKPLQISPRYIQWGVFSPAILLLIYGSLFLLCSIFFP